LDKALLVHTAKLHVNTQHSSVPPPELEPPEKLLKLFDAQNTRLDAQDAVFEVSKQHAVRFDNMLDVQKAVLDAKSMLLL
jgi:hypothetical protein